MCVTYPKGNIQTETTPTQALKCPLTFIHLTAWETQRTQHHLQLPFDTFHGRPQKVASLSIMVF